LLDFHYVPFEQLMRESHVVTLHVPLNPMTRHMIKRETLALCRGGSPHQHGARRADRTDAVIEALDSGRWTASDPMSSRTNGLPWWRIENPRREDRNGQQYHCPWPGNIFSSRGGVFSRGEQPHCRGGLKSFLPHVAFNVTSDGTPEHVDSRKYQELS
jgi:hypothetical protein